MPIATEPNEQVSTVWPPPPSGNATDIRRSESGSFRLAGVEYTETVDKVIIDNSRIKAASIAFWAWQAIVLCGTLWVQYQSMLWFQNVWGFHGRAVVLEVGLQAVVWIGMAFAYGWFDWTSYNHYSRFRATFDRSTDRFLEGAHDSGPISRVLSVEVRRRSSLFARWYEVRLHLAKTNAPRIDHRATVERCLGSFRNEDDAHRIAEALGTFIGTSIRVG